MVKPTQKQLKDLKQDYWMHKCNAKIRNIKFLLTFEQWLSIWLESGHLTERGPKKDQYVMARFGDKGPYKVGNVKIITFSKNSTEAWLGRKHSEEAKRKNSIARTNWWKRASKEAIEARNTKIAIDAGNRSPESRERHRAAMQAWWDKRRGIS